MFRLFRIRQTLIFLLLIGSSTLGHAQLVDELLGQPRNKVSVLLRPYRIIDYKKERVVHNVQKGIHQTVLFENDTCKRFYWAVTPDNSDKFKSMLLDAGYSIAKNIGFVKDSLQLMEKPLKSGKATLYIAALSKELKGNRDASGAPVVDRETVVNIEAMPLMHQAILAEENDTTPKPLKDPTDNWVGGKYGKVEVLGW